MASTAPKRKKRLVSYEDMHARAQHNMALAVGIFVLAILTVLPLAIGPRGYGNITEVKLYTYVALFVALLLGLGVAFYSVVILGYWPKAKPGAWKERIKPHEIALGLYLLVSLVSAITSKNPAQAWGGTTNRSEGFWIQLSYVAVFLIVSRLYKPKLRDLMIFALVGIPIAAYGIMQYYGMDIFSLNAQGLRDVAIIFFSTMSNKNMFSVYLCVIFCISTVLFCQHETKLRWVFLPCALITFYMALLGDTESGYVGLLGSFALLFALIIKDRQSAARFFLLAALCAVLGWLYPLSLQVFIQKTATVSDLLGSIWLKAALAFAVIAAVLGLIRRPLPLHTRAFRIGWIGVVVLVAIVAVLLLPGVAERTGHRLLMEANDLLHGNLYDSMGSNRGYIWNRALQLVGQHPILGHGPDNFGWVFYEQFGEEAASRYGVMFDKAHNEYLQSLVDVGILGVGSLLAFYFLLLWRARKHVQRPMVVAVGLAMVFFMIQAFFNFAQPFTTPIIWTLWGVLAALVRQEEEGSEGLRRPAS